VEYFFDFIENSFARHSKQAFSALAYRNFSFFAALIFVFKPTPVASVVFVSGAYKNGGDSRGCKVFREKIPQGRRTRMIFSQKTGGLTLHHASSGINFAPNKNDLRCEEKHHSHKRGLVRAEKRSAIPHVPFRLGGWKDFI